MSIQWTKRIIIGGLPRSGSTLLRWILDATDEIISGPETGIFTRSFTTERRSDPKWIQKVAEALGLPCVEVRSILEAHTDPVHGFDELMCRYAGQYGYVKRAWAEKTPNNCLQYQQLADAHPELLFISTIRDGRDVVTSKIDGRSSYYVSNDRYLECMQAVLDFDHPNHRIIKYEDLVSDPDQSISTLFEFLGIQFDKQVLNKYREQSATRDLDKVHQSKVTQPISSNWVQRWKQPQHASRVRDFVNYPGVRSMLEATGYPHIPQHDEWIEYKPPASGAKITDTPTASGKGSDADMGLLSANLDKREQKRIRKVLDRELHPHRGEHIITRQQALECCNYPPEAIEIIEGSTYNPNHGHVGLHRHIRAGNIINDFFKPSDFQGKRVVEFGPGHYSFAMLARELGAEVVCVERHEEHARLGRVLGFQVIEKDFDDVTLDDLGGPVDGLWMKGAFNACRMPSDESIAALATRMTGFIKPDGWAWCVTVNMLSKEDLPEDPEVLRCVEIQRQAFDDSGWTIEPINEDDRKRYAMSYKGCQYYFTRSLASAPNPAPTKPQTQN
ncbi:MAG: sulfotransferase [Phycisphaerales bacterium]|nr:sulfotransferase [Phycisphaerales bacterium]